MNQPSALLFDATHTSHTRAQTGIQRVCRSLFAALERSGAVATAVTHDRYLRAWRPVNAAELTRLRPGQAAASTRGARWPLHQRVTSRARRVFGAKLPLPAADGLLCPELFSAEVGMHLPEIFAAVRGPRVALFHDAIALKFPELTPAKTVARFPAYLRELLLFDGIAAVSEDSRDSLLSYWRWLGVTATPPVQALPLGLAPVRHAPRDASFDGADSIVLSVGSIEGRKNHLALLDACERLWSGGSKFELRLIGLAHAQTGQAALGRIRALQAAGRRLRYDGPLGDDAVDATYAECAFTVYPSLTEGFGLPVIESLAHGKPCVCSSRGAIGESARGGGTVMLDVPDAANIAAAMQRLFKAPAELAALAEAARARKFKSWDDYAAELTAWMQRLPRRS